MTVLQTAEAIAGAAGTIQERAAHIIALARTLIESPPVIKLSRTTITPDDVPGANDAEKIRNAHAEAVERNKPFRWNRKYASQNIRLTEAHDGLVIVADPGCGPALPDDPVANIPEWGWLYYVAPAAGRSCTITMRGVSVFGNRAKAARVLNTANSQSHTQFGLVLGNVGLGRARVIVESSEFYGFDMSGVVVMGDDCELVGSPIAYGNGNGGIEATRGRVYLRNARAYENGGVGFNASSCEYFEAVDSQSYRQGRGQGKPPVGKTLAAYAGGVGFKLAARPGDEATKHSVRVHLVNCEIRDNGGVGLTSTSAGVGSVIGGNGLILSGNGSGAIYLTDASSVSIGRVETRANFTRITDYADDYAQPALDDNSAEVLMVGGNAGRFEALTIKDGPARGLQFGWGSSLEVGALNVTGCGSTGIRRVGTGPDPVFDSFVSNNNKPDEL